MAADVLGVSVLRAATSMTQEMVALVLREHDRLELGVPETLNAKVMLTQLKSMPPEDWTSEYVLFRAELASIFLEMRVDEPIVSAGVISEAPVADDVGARVECLQSMTSAVRAQFPNAADEQDSQEAATETAPTLGSAADMADPTSGGGDASVAPDAPLLDSATGRKLKYPRVDPPEVEDRPGLAIREDTPGYICQAFPKCFPHGTGDFHDPRDGLRKHLKFEEWGRHIMLWHDGRFMRHTRFRYWLLDTSLRLMTPQMQRTFFRTREAATKTLEELNDKTVRKTLVQQMSTVTSGLPGSVGERRKMRHELESMVQQIEAETADNDENAGAGRVPAGFCTLT